MKGKIMCHVVSLCGGATVALLLTGCNPTTGATEYEVIYPSGYSRDSYAYDEKSPIEGSSCYLQWEEADDYKKTYDYNIHILDENGSVLYEYPDMGSKAIRGSVWEDGKTWVCAEHWTAPHHNGYVKGWLKESEKLFGLIKIPAENAVIYYRDTSDWTQKHTVYTFDYVAEPDIDTSNGVLTRIKFYISENQLKVAWTSYEPVGNEKWEYLEKKAYEIPLAENASE